jgi:hypothetical protein
MWQEQIAGLRNRRAGTTEIGTRQAAGRAVSQRQLYCGAERERLAIILRK